MCFVAVIVGCGREGDYGIYTADTDDTISDSSHLNFTKIIDVASSPTGITHNPETRDIYIALHSGPIVKTTEDGMENQTIFTTPADDASEYHQFVCNIASV